MFTLGDDRMTLPIALMYLVIVVCAVLAVAGIAAIVLLELTRSEV